MKIAGLNKCSLVDYPGKVAAVVFTQGCNLRCHYCHNTQLVYPEQYGELFPSDYVTQFLKDRAGKLDGLVITGGEPLLQHGLESFMLSVKRMGYCIKLDTNGTHPQLLRRLLASGLCDYVAMDIKAPLDKYSLVAGVTCSGDIILESIRILEESTCAYHFRTTFSEDFLSADDLFNIRSMLRPSSVHVTQDYLSPKVLNFVKK